MRELVGQVGFLHFKCKLSVKRVFQLLSYIFNGQDERKGDRVYDNESGFSRNPVYANIYSLIIYR